MPRKGDRLRYRSVSGEVYDAVVVGDLYGAGFVPIEIRLPGIREPVKINRAKWRDADDGGVTVCWPRAE